MLPLVTTRQSSAQDSGKRRYIEPTSIRRSESAIILKPRSDLIENLTKNTSWIIKKRARAVEKTKIEKGMALCERMVTRPRDVKPNFERNTTMRTQRGKRESVRLCNNYSTLHEKRSNRLANKKIPTIQTYRREKNQQATSRNRSNTLTIANVSSPQ